MEAPITPPPQIRTRIGSPLAIANRAMRSVTPTNQQVHVARRSGRMKGEFALPVDVHNRMIRVAKLISIRTV